MRFRFRGDRESLISFSFHQVDFSLQRAFTRKQFHSYLIRFVNLNKLFEFTGLLDSRIPEIISLHKRESKTKWDYSFSVAETSAVFSEKFERHLWKFCFMLRA